MTYLIFEYDISTQPSKYFNTDSHSIHTTIKHATIPRHKPTTRDVHDSANIPEQIFVTMNKTPFIRALYNADKLKNKINKFIWISDNREPFVIEKEC